MAAQVALACVLCVALRLPSFRYDVISDDEAIYDAMAQSIARGGVMYHEVVDHKPPGLAYTYAWAQRAAAVFFPAPRGDAAMALVHVLGLLAAMGTCVGLFGVARRVLAPNLVGLPSLLYAIFSTVKQPVDGLAVNGELLMNLPTVLGVWAALVACDRRGAKRALLDGAAGALLAAAALYKYQSALAGVGFLALVFDVREPAKRSTPIARLAALAVGFALPFGAVALFFFHRGVLDEALAWGLRFNRSYVAEGAGLSWALSRLGMQLAGVVLPGALLYVAGAVALSRLVRRPSDDVVHGRALLVAWSAASALSVAIGGRFFGHYFLQLELPLALLAAGPVWRALHAHPTRVLLATSVPALFFFTVGALPEWSRPILNARDPDYRAVGSAIAARTRPDDTIWVWGNVPQIYHAAQRAPGVRFTFCNYLTGLSPATPSEEEARENPHKHAVAWAWPLVVEDLDRRRPTLVLDTAAAGWKSYEKFPLHDFPVLADYLARHYRREGDIASAVVYRRVD